MTMMTSSGKLLKRDIGIHFKYYNSILLYNL